MLKKVLSNRRGIAIEMAILVTVVCFAVSAIILSSVLLQYEKKVHIEEQMDENINLEQIGEKFLSASDKDTFEKWVSANYDGYTAEMDITDMDNKSLIIKKDGATVLTIEVKNGTIIRWQKD